MSNNNYPMTSTASAPRYETPPEGHYTIALYSYASGDRAIDVEYAPTEREARSTAARMLGHDTLRGAAKWVVLYGIVYQFGPRDQDNTSDTAVIMDYTGAARWRKMLEERDAERRMSGRSDGGTDQ